MKFLLRPDPLPPHKIPDPGAQRVMQKVRHIEASHMQHQLRDLDKDTQPEPQKQDLPALAEGMSMPLFLEKHLTPSDARLFPI